MAGTAPTTPNYEVNYEDERFKQNEANKQSALTENNQMYEQMINQSGAFYNDQIEASKQWAEQQQQLQQEQTDFAIEQIEQQREQTQKDYIKEQSGAYADWQKQSNQYGANAEQMASSGLAGSGYSESAQVSMYNSYQNRVAAARQTVSDANLQFDNAIQQAMLENNVNKAEIAYQAYQQQLQLALDNFQYNNELLMQQTATRQQIEAQYMAQHQAILDQINQEHALAEEVRQYNANLLEEQRQYDEQMAYKKEQDRISQENWQKEYELMLAQKEPEEQSYGDIEDEEVPKTSYDVTDTVYDAISDSIQEQTKQSSYNPIASQIGQSSSISTFQTKKAPSSISGYGTVSPQIYDGEQVAAKIDGKVYDIYKTSDGTLWYWNGNKYVKWASNPLNTTGRKTSLAYTNNSTQSASTKYNNTNPLSGIGTGFGGLRL